MHSVELCRLEKSKLSEVYAQQEVFWRQRSKQLWLREGDQNSKFFHSATKIRRRNNQISFLVNSSGVKVGWDDGLESLMVSYFTQLFEASDTEWTEVTNCIARTVTDEHNADLLAPVSDIEVKQALFHMHPDKSPGPDGMSPGFYQRYWDIVGYDIVQVVKQFFTDGILSEQLTSTNIVLIPKKKSPQTMADLRPISLCNIAYKIISKVMANRLKHILPFIISVMQSAFIPGRMITDNILIAHEVMHFMKRKTKGMEGWMALKLDMSKAYDRVEWSFLKAVLTKMGFDRHWVKLIMSCVVSANYQIAHSGRVFGSIVPQRGIRQGDPLSSYLFLICIEGFTALIHDYERRQLIKGIRIARNVPDISHMFFADDSFIFFKATSQSANNVLEMLKNFERASGQKINVDKSSIFFSRNTNEEVKSSLLQQLRFQEAGAQSLYLGLPCIMQRNKSAIFGYLKSKLQETIQEWDKRSLSKGGKEIILKIVAQSLPNYAMSIFLLPVEVCHDIERLMCRYWWR